MSTIPTPDQRVVGLASRQHGAVSRRQALAAGLSARQVQLRIDAGRWTVAVPGAYVLAGSPDSWQRRAWVAHLATDGLASHLTAAAAHGLARPSPLPHVTVPRRASGRARAAVIHHGEVPLVDRCRRDDLPCTSVSRTVVDLAGVLHGEAFESLLDDALCRRLASTGSIAAADRIGPGRTGLTRLRAALEVWSEQIRPGSVAEVRLLRLLGDLGLTGLVTQHSVHDEAGAFVARLDVGLPDARRGFEYDSALHHNPRRWARDEARYARLRALGWEIAAVTKLDLLPGEPRLAALVARWGIGIAA